MKLIYRKGDLLASSLRFIVHGCNAQGVMGSGIALAIRQTYPKAFQDYRDVYDLSGLKAGQTIWSDVGDRVVINAVTQEFYGRDPNVVYVSYDGIRAAIRAINESAIIRKNLLDGLEPQMVGFPQIGAGLGNGDWAIIEAIIEEESTHFQPVIYQL